MSTFKMNVGEPYDQYVLPSVEECLRAFDATFYSAQNALRIHEWLGDASTVSLLLKKVDSEEEVSFLSPLSYQEMVIKYKKELGMYIYLPKAYLGRIMPMHQIAHAMPELIAAEKDPTNSDERNEFIQDNLRLMAVHTATAIFHNVHIPKRLKYLSPDVLPLVLFAVLTQRSRVKYKPTEVVRTTHCSENEAMIINIIFNELLMCIDANRFVDIESFNPVIIASSNAMIPMEAYKQVAMAMSAVMGVGIPTTYLATEETHWFKKAVTLLNLTRDELSSFRPAASTIKSHLRSVK